jgi:DNA-binding transcriptional MocR family regulator
MLLIALDKKDPQPAYRQIAHRIGELIETEVIGDGEVLPPTRRLARQLNVSRYTVYCAYQELWSRGMLASTPGSYSRARARAPRARATRVKPRAPRAAGPLSAPTAPLGRTTPPAPADGLIDLGAYRLDEALFPMRDLRRAFQRVSRDEDAALLHYADPQGYLPLRQTIASRLRSHSIPAEPENILITNGALHGLDLSFRLLARGGGKIIVEEPAFTGALDLCRLHGVTPIGVPLREDGMDADALGKRLEHRDLRFLFIIPSFQNPSGITTSQERRERILSLCESRSLPIVEDAFEEEMSYFGGVVLPMKSMDRNGSVLSLGTFSKVLFPGLRIGWIAADRCRIEKLCAIRKLNDDGGNTLMQAAMAELCRSGSYQKHLELVNKVYSRRMRAALDALANYIPAEKAAWTRPTGGYLIWLTLASTSMSEAELHSRLRAHGVDAESGSRCFTKPPAHLHLRLSISAHPEEVLREGIRRLGRALETA